MKKSGRVLLWTIAVPISLALITTGCATKKYARQQASKVNQRVSQVEKKTNDQISYINNKQETDMSQVNERISTTDLKLNEVAGTAQQAMQQGEANRAQISENTAAISQNATGLTDLSNGVSNALNYKLVDKADVYFGFNKSVLTPAAKAELDMIVQKSEELPRSVIELVGFTDPIGSTNYNLALSRRRAESVQRYLVNKKVPPRAIHIVGLGKEAPPPWLAAEVSPSSKATPRERDKMERRVFISLYGASDITQGSASRSEP